MLTSLKEKVIFFKRALAWSSNRIYDYILYTIYTVYIYASQNFKNTKYNYIFKNN